MNRARSILLLGTLLATCFVCASCERRPGERGASEPLASAGPVSARLTLDQSTITTAQRFRATLEVRTAPGHLPEPIDLKPLEAPGFSIIAADPERRTQEPDGSTHIVRQFMIEPFLDGTFELPALEIKARAPKSPGAPAQDDAPNVIVSASTEPISVQVTSVLASGQEELAGTTDVVDPPWRMNWWLAGASAAALALATWGLVAWNRRRRRPPEPFRTPAHTLALSRLDALMARKLVEAGRFKEFYEEASFILRRYIEDRFGVHAPERTTEEFLQESRASTLFMDDDLRVLERFLGHCDMVKFAALIPSSREAEQVAASVREFVERTQSADRLVVVDEPMEAAPS